MVASTRSSRKVNQAIGWSAVLFLLVLFVSALFDKTIRVLHVFEAIPYAVVPWLCTKKPKIGYTLGFASGTFWILCAGFLTTFIRNGFERVIMFATSGTVDRPDLLLAVLGFIGTFGLALFSLVGYWRLPNKTQSDILLFLAMFATVTLFFLIIFSAFAPQYLGMFTHFFL